MIVPIFLLQIIFVAEVFSIGLTDEQRQTWASDIRSKCGPTCSDLISEESLIYLDDDYQADNEEIRAYRCCMATCAGYMEGNKMNIANILNDAHKYVSTLSIPEKEGGKIMLNICRTEAEFNENPNDVAGVFYNCIYDRMKSDL